MLHLTKHMTWWKGKCQLLCSQAMLACRNFQEKCMIHIWGKTTYASNRFQLKMLTSDSIPHIWIKQQWFHVKFWNSWWQQNGATTEYLDTVFFILFGHCILCVNNTCHQEILLRNKQYNDKTAYTIKNCRIDTKQWAIICTPRYERGSGKWSTTLTSQAGF